MMRDYLAVTMPGERKMMWLAEENEGDAARGVAPLGAGEHPPAGRHRRRRDPGAPQGTPPGHRPRAADRAGAACPARRASPRSASRSPGDTTAVDFYQPFGFTLAFTEIRSVLRLDTVDWFSLGDLAAGIGAGYQIEFYAGGPPEHLIEAYAAAKAEVRDDYDLGDLELRPSSYEPQRLRASLRTLAARDSALRRGRRAREDGRGRRPHRGRGAGPAPRPAPTSTTPSWCPATAATASAARSRPGCCSSCARPSPA